MRNLDIVASHQELVVVYILEWYRHGGCDMLTLEPNRRLDSKDGKAG